MITIKAACTSDKRISGNCLITGRAYRLTSNSTDPEFVGDIYIRGTSDIVSLSNPGHSRAARERDKYVEVDLEITVKEKT